MVAEMLDAIRINSVCWTVSSTAYEIKKCLFCYPLKRVFLFQANGIIKKLQGEIRELLGKIKVKNSVTVSQEKLLQETSAQLQRLEKEFQSAQETLASKEEQVWCRPLAHD